jgi:beta-glucanase (GH16 family)
LIKTLKIVILASASFNPEKSMINNNTIILCLIPLLAGCATGGTSQDIQGNSPTATISTTASDWTAPTGMSVDWQDEFNGASIDTSVWSYETEATGWSKIWNKELQDYVDNGTGGANAYIGTDSGNKCLVIKATKKTDGYDSVRMVTHGKKHWKYGVIAAKMKLPYSQGMWPAFWMLPEKNASEWPKTGEIDIMELIGGGAGRDNMAYGTIHGPGYSGGHGIQGRVILSSGDFRNDYHVFEIRWDEGQVRWYVDGILYHTVKKTIVPDAWPFDNGDFYILFNLAVGGSWPGSPDGTTVFPQYMYIDWVRVYQ